MAFTVRNLSVVTRARGFTLWHYTAGRSPLAAVVTSGFFDAAAGALVAGDILMISAREGRTAKGVAGGNGDPIRLAAL